jgi:hypothetical protein
MMVDPHQPDVAPTFAALARRISSWTSKGLVSALVLAAGLAFGSQVLRWWAADKILPDSSAGLELADGPLAADGLGDPAREHRLRFGESPWSMTCRTVVASKQDALAMLRAACAELIRSDDGLPATPPEAAEREWLVVLSSRQPVQQEPGRWALYESEEPNVIVVGTRPGPRVVTWGMAIPGDGSQWSLYTLQWMPLAGSGGLEAVGGGREPADVDAELPPCPPGSTKILSIRATGGGAMVSFRGPADSEAWRRFFDSWLAAHRWTTGGPWRQYGLQWHMHCDGNQTKQGGTLDLDLGPDGRGGQAGLVILTKQS